MEERERAREAWGESCVFVVEIESKIRFSQVVAVSGTAASSADGASRRNTHTHTHTLGQTPPNPSLMSA